MKCSKLYISNRHLLYLFIVFYWYEKSLIIFFIQATPTHITERAAYINNYDITVLRVVLEPRANDKWFHE